MTKCLGCGVELNYIDNNSKGYTPNIDSSYCERCFKIKNYNYHDEKDIIANSEIIDKINKKNAYVIFLCDFLSINNKTVDLYNKISQNKIFVVTKMDIIPKNMILKKLENNLKKTYKINKILFLSIKNDIGSKELFNILDDNNRAIFVGPTSSGKSSLINYLFDTNITVSNYQNTTIDFNEFIYENKTIIDAPGFNSNFLISTVKEFGYLKPRTIFIKKGYTITINNNKIYFEDDANITLIFNKNVNIISSKSKEVFTNRIKINNNNDIIINNIGFIYLKNRNIAYVSNIDNIEVRESIVGKDE